jgi:hypothetical protein
LGFPVIPSARALIYFAVALAATFPVQAQFLGELGPHFRDKSIQYIGEFDGYHAYIQKNAAGDLGSPLANDILVSKVISVKEHLGVVFRRPADGLFASLGYWNPKDRNRTLSDLEFKVPPPGSVIARAWENVSNPKASSRSKGRQIEWLAVIATEEGRQVRRYFVGPKITTDAKSGLESVPLLLVAEDRFLLMINPRRNEFSPTPTDRFWSPLEKVKYGDIKPDSAPAAILRLLNAERAN